jgi:hypothetical protein
MDDRIDPFQALASVVRASLIEVGASTSGLYSGRSGRSPRRAGTDPCPRRTSIAPE